MKNLPSVAHLLPTANMSQQNVFRVSCTDSFMWDRTEAPESHLNLPGFDMKRSISHI